MLVVGSSATPKKGRVYHKINCIYAKRIKFENRIEMSPKQAENRKFCECKYCAGLKGDIRTHKKQIKNWEEKQKMTLTYHENSNTLYVQTEIGCWKIFRKAENGKYVLYHRNIYDKNMPTEEIFNGDYHRQKDMNTTESIDKIIHYIAAHDKANAIIMDDYHKLPQQSKKQKKYYRQAKRRVKAQSYRRLDSIFAMLEAKDPALKSISFS